MITNETKSHSLMNWPDARDITDRAVAMQRWSLALQSELAAETSLMLCWAMGVTA